ncbi:MAG TPA: hypothetical protein VK669_15265 [Candidatus Limnocylindrales bacterium]|nr:hypothetical protein [Candidatus Limnocylindrales bacterium]
MMVTVIVVVESGVPVPSVLAYVAIVTVVLPAGTWTSNVHVNPFDPDAQLGFDALSATTTRPALLVTEADCVADET